MSESKFKEVEVVLENEYGLALGPNAITFFNRGHYGTPNKNGLLLNGFEILYLFELGRINVKKNDIKFNEGDITNHFSNFIKSFLLRYIVYKDLRNRGYIVNLGQGSTFFFRLYARNTKPTTSSAKYYVTPLPEGGSIPITSLEQLNILATESSKKLTFAMVDAVGDVSYLYVDELQFSLN